MSTKDQCPGCGQWTVEHLKSHSHCWECNFNPEESADVQQWRSLETAGLRGASIRQANRCPLRDAAHDLRQGIEKSYGR